MLSRWLKKVAEFPKIWALPKFSHILGMLSLRISSIILVFLAFFRLCKSIRIKTQNIWHTNRESEYKNPSQNHWIAGGEQAKTSSLEIIPSNKIVTGGADLVTLDTRIQGRIRVRTRKRGHNLWEPLDITEVWEYISEPPGCKLTLLQTLIHSITLSFTLWKRGIRRHHNVHHQLL